EQNSFFAEQSELGADRHDFIRHGTRSGAAVFSFGLCTWLHAPALDVLADPFAYVARLHGTYADHQGVAAPQSMHLGNISADRVRFQVEKISRSWTTIGMEPYSDGVWHRKPAVGFLREWRLRVASHAVNYRLVRSLSAF